MLSMTRWASRTSSDLANDSPKSRGFTIVELLIVIVVIGILAAITIVAYNGITGRAKLAAAQSAAEQAAKKVTTYAISNADALPSTLATAGISDSGGTTYQYTLNSAATPNNYCITATNSGTSVQVAGTSSAVFKPVEGPCAGHAGTAPTVAASGSCPTGYIVVPGSSLYGTDAFCVMKYEAKNSSGTAVSTSTAQPWVSISQTDAFSTATAACAGCHLITEAEWLTIAQNVLSVGSNWSGGTVGSGAIYSGHNDNDPAGALNAGGGFNPCYSTVTGMPEPTCGVTSGAQRRTLTLNNGEVIWDFAGNVWEWTQGTTEGGNQPGASGYAWRNWNALTVLGTFASNPYPSYANASAAGWVASTGMGQVHSDSTQTNLQAFRRGGPWSDGASAGIYSLALNFSPPTTNGGVGFRVAR